MCPLDLEVHELREGCCGGPRSSRTEMGPPTHVLTGDARDGQSPALLHLPGDSASTGWHNFGTW